MASWLLGTGIMLIHVLNDLGGDGINVEPYVTGCSGVIISLLTFPYAAVPAYWLFGRLRFYGYVTARGARDSVLAGCCSLST